MRRVVLLLALTACDRVFGIGDPYEDARGVSNGSDAASDAITGSGGDAVTTIDASLVSQAIVHFTFDGTMNDDQLRTVAACTGGGTCGAVTGGHVGFGSLELSGGGCVKFVPNSMPAQWSIAMWVYPSSGAQQTLISRLYGPASTHLIWRLAGSSTNSLTFTTYNGSVDLSMFSADKLGVNTWQHLVATYDGTTIRFYVNTQVAGTLATILAAAGDVEVALGCDAGGAGGFYTGNIDDVFLYDRALTSTEVATLYGLGN